MALKLPPRTIKLLNNDYRRSEGIALAQAWIDEQQTKIDARMQPINKTKSELLEISSFVSQFAE